MSRRPSVDTTISAAARLADPDSRLFANIRAEGFQVPADVCYAALERHGLERKNLEALALYTETATGKPLAQLVAADLDAGAKALLHRRALLARLQSARSTAGAPDPAALVKDNKFA